MPLSALAQTNKFAGTKDGGSTLRFPAVLEAAGCAFGNLGGNALGNSEGAAGTCGVAGLVIGYFANLF